MAIEATKKLDIVEIAMKKRRLKLYEKISRGDVITRAELKELKKYEEGEADPGVVDSWKDIQRVFGISEMTVSRWIKLGMPVREDGKFCIVDIQTWKNAREIHSKNSDDKTSKSSTKRKEEAEADYREHKAELARIEVAVKKGELVKKTDVEAGLIQVSTAIKMALLKLPTILAPRLQGLEPRHIEKEVREQIETIIDSISKEKIFNSPVNKNAGNSRKTKNLDAKRK